MPKKKAKRSTKPSTATGKSRAGTRVKARQSKQQTSVFKRALAALVVAFKFWWWRVSLVLLVGVFGYVAYLDVTIRDKFEGQKWALPAHVYTRPLDLYVGQAIDQDLILQELKELGYQQRDQIDRVGSYRVDVNQILIHQREFRFWDGLQPQQQVRLTWGQNRIEQISTTTLAQQLGGAAEVETEIIRLEPRLFGSVSPLSHEDRSLLKLEDVPPQLINALIAIEDRQFYSHFGINPIGIARAMVANISAGRFVQGGSTLTQQLVKNYYLTSDRTLRRKLVEVIMAVLLEVHYSKEEILQAYLNEVFLSQAGNRAIHGFALGSQYFFGRPLAELDLPELATLAGMIKGPSLYSPIRRPERAQQRRDLVLRTMLEEGYIDQPQHDRAVATKLRVNKSVAEVAPLSYPSFIGFLRQGLQDQYQQQDILSDGLQIHTTLDPRVQKTLETRVSKELSAIEKDRGMAANTLQAAAVVIRTDNGEVAAMVGDRKSNFSGYNRALKARRPVGSLLKPFVYLTALENPEKYSLASVLEDVNIIVSQRGSPDWKPKNYGGKEHGDVMLIDALSHSYNLATVRLGMSLGVDKVLATVRRAGYQGDAQPLPSLLLGAVPMSVMEVGQMYLTLASDGFKTPIKAIRSVLSSEDQPLDRFSLSIDQVVDPEFNTLINFGLQDVVRNGTARSVLPRFGRDFGLAGKTGTTNDYRDSWFAGYSGNYLMVIWIGRDDNKPTGLTGASGAARVWSKVMRDLPLDRLELPFHEDISYQRIFHSANADLHDCSRVRQLPILSDSLPLERLPCAEHMQYDLDDDEFQHFEPDDQGAEPNATRPQRKRRKSLWERIFG